MPPVAKAWLLERWEGNSLARIGFLIHSAPRSDIGTRSFYHLALAAVN